MAGLLRARAPFISGYVTLGKMTSPSTPACIAMGETKSTGFSAFMHSLKLAHLAPIDGAVSQNLGMNPARAIYDLLHSDVARKHPTDVELLEVRWIVVHPYCKRVAFSLAVFAREGIVNFRTMYRRVNDLFSKGYLPARVVIRGAQVDHIPYPKSFMYLVNAAKHWDQTPCNLQFSETGFLRVGFVTDKSTRQEFWLSLEFPKDWGGAKSSGGTPPVSL